MSGKGIVREREKVFNPFKDKKNPGVLHSSPIVRRYENNPLLTAADVPYPATFVFNTGVAFYRGLYDRPGSVYKKRKGYCLK